MKKAALGILAIAWMAAAPASDDKTLSVWVLASEAGAALNSDLEKGGGTDDTVVLQRILDRAKSGRPVHLIIDGPALIAGLDIHSNTTIECTAGGGFYLKDSTPRAILRNAHRTREAVIDQQIAIRGCFINGNRMNQAIVGPESSPYRVAQDRDGEFRSGLQFLGVHHLTIEGVVLWDTLAFGAWIANAKFVHIENVTVERPVTAFPEHADIAGIKAWFKQNVFGAYGGQIQGKGNDDGLHFNGPIQYLTIDNVKLRTWDDGIALNANENGVDDITVNNDWGPHLGQGPITDVAISNVVFMDAHHGMRLLSSTQRIDRIVIQNVTGTIRERGVLISPFSSPSHGNFGSITFSNVNVNLRKFPFWTELFPEWDLQKHMDDFAHATAAEKKAKYDLGEEVEIPLFSLDGRIEHLSLRNVTARVSDRSRPVIRVGAKSAIDTLNADLSILDPAAQAIPLKLMGRIERLNLALDWPGERPIEYKGGSVGQLRWIHVDFVSRPQGSGENRTKQ